MDNKEFWDKVWSTHSPSGGIPWDIKKEDDNLRDCLNNIPIKKDKALELGCGTGYDSAFLRDQGFKVTAIDVSEYIINVCKRNHKNIDFLVMDISKELPKDSFDLIYDRGCIHNNKDNIKQSLKNIKDCLNKDGYFIMVSGGEEDSEYPRPEKFYIFDFLNDIRNLFEIVLIKKINFDLTEDNGQFPGWLFVLKNA